MIDSSRPRGKKKKEKQKKSSNPTQKPSPQIDSLHVRAPGWGKGKEKKGGGVGGHKIVHVLNPVNEFSPIRTSGAEGKEKEEKKC